MIRIIGAGMKKKKEKKKSMKEITKNHTKFMRRKKENSEGLEDFEKVLETLTNEGDKNEDKKKK